MQGRRSEGSSQTMEAQHLDHLVTEIAAFRSHFSVIFLATVDADGQPESSHAPFVMDDQGSFYVLISGLARHTRNLMVNPQASALLLEEAGDRSNPFALKRLQYTCEAQVIGRDSDPDGRERILAMMRERFGRVIETLSALGDFQLVRLRPIAGKYVKGFAKTYTLTGEELGNIAHVNPARD